MIFLKNKQKKYAINYSAYEKKMMIILKALEYQDFDISVIFVSERLMRTINAQYRKKDQVTDVLSFPYHADAIAGKKIKVFDLEEQNLGDIFVCPSYIFKNKKGLIGTFQERMDYLIIHGICHLLGYDHETENDFKRMARLEKKLIGLIK